MNDILPGQTSVWQALERTFADVVGEYVTIECARSEYGVVIDGSPPEVDLEATRALRKKIRADGAKGGAK